MCIRDRIYAKQIANNTDKKIENTEPINEPFSPKISNISINYNAKTSMIFKESDRIENDYDENNSFFLISPTGIEKTFSKESVKNRMESGISFTEFSYQLIQAYDFYHLYNSMNCEIQIGGGIRNIEIVNSYLSLGIRRVILGTSAFEDNVFLDRAIKENPGRIAVGIDIKDNFVAIKGWESKIRMGLKEALTKFRKKNIDLIVLTSVDRDGTLEGYNVELVNEYLKNTSVPLIVSGGIKNEDDLNLISKLCNQTVYGVILGKSLYEDKIDLKKCIEVYEDVS